MQGLSFLSHHKTGTDGTPLNQNLPQMLLLSLCIRKPFCDPARHSKRRVLGCHKGQGLQVPQGSYPARAASLRDLNHICLEGAIFLAQEHSGK